MTLRHLTRLAIALLAPLLLQLPLASPAQAEQATISDERDGDLAAKHDIRRVRLVNEKDRLVVRVTVREMKTRNVMLNVKFRDGRGAPHYARVWNNKKYGKGHDVLVQVIAGDPWTSFPCKGLRHRWLPKKDQIVLSLPHSPKNCGGAAYERFKVYTGPWGAGEVRDRVVRRAALSMG